MEQSAAHALNALPAQGFVRLRQILGDPKATPPLPPIIPVSRATWYKNIGIRYPRQVSIGRRAVAWRVEDIRKLILQGAL